MHRAQAGEPDDDPEVPGDGPGELWPVEHLDARGLSREWETAPPALPEPGDEAGGSVAVDLERAGELIAAGAGRRRLSRELGVSEHTARQLLARNGSGQ
jgi:hypothetical protein